MTASRNDQAFLADLLGYHLDLIEPETRARVESHFADAESLASALATMRAHLAPLDADADPVAPHGLTQRVLARVERSRTIIPISKRLPDVAAEAACSESSRGSMFTIRELLGLAAVIAIFAGIFVPGYRTARNNARRVVCMNNLGVIGGGFESYAHANGSYPYAGETPANARWLTPRNAAGRVTLNNSHHVFQLLNGGFVPPEAFIDPGEGRAGDVPLNMANLDGLTDFPNSHNSSYSYDLVRGWMQVGAIDPLRPLGGDMNPFFDGGRSGSALGPVSNSRSHGRPGGQNVLRFNLSVTWWTTPRVGIDNDDIYRVADVRGAYTGFEQPRSQTDAFLIP